MNEFRLYGDYNNLPKAISNEESIRLLILANNGDYEARNKVVNGNMRLVASFINKNYANCSFDVKEELFSVGCIGLIKAIDNFDLSLGYELSTYAIPMISGEIKRHMRDNNLMHIPRTIMDLSVKIINIQNDNLKRTGIELNSHQLSEILGESEENIITAINSCQKVSSLSEPLVESNDGDFKSLEDIIEDSNFNIDDVIYKVDIENSISTALKSMSTTEQKIINELYGLKNNSPKSQIEVGKINNISQAQVSRIAKKFKRRLKLDLDGKEIKTKYSKKKLKDLFEYFPEYNKTEVINAFNLLNESDKKLLELRYGLNGNKQMNPSEISKVMGLESSVISLKIFRAKNEISNKLKIIENFNKESSDIMTGNSVKKDLFSLYSEYTKQQVIEAIDSLSEENKKIIELRYGLNGNKQMMPKEISEIMEFKYSLINVRINNIKKQIKSILEKSKMDIKDDWETVFSLYPEYSEEQIIDAVNRLSEENKKIIELRYGLNGNNINSLKDICMKCDIKDATIKSKISRIRSLIKNLLENPNKNFSNVKTLKNNEDFFKLYPEYTKDQILEVINNLNDENRKIIELRYGLNGNNVTKLKQLSELIGINYNTLSVRISSIKKIIEKNLKKANEVINTLDDIKSQILENRFGLYARKYELRDFDITVEVKQSDALLAKISNNYFDLDRANALTKKCYVYLITKLDKLGNIIEQIVMVKDINTNDFYKYVKRFDDATYDLSDVNLDEYICYCVSGFNILPVKSNKRDEQVVENKTPKIKEAKLIDENAEFYFGVGLELHRNRKFLESEIQLKKALNTDKKYVLQRANLYLGKIYFTRKKGEVAEKYLKEALKYNPTDYNTLLEIAKSLSIQGKYDEALEYIKECSRVYPKRFDHLLWKAKIYKYMGEPEKALAELDYCISKRGKDYFFHYEKGKLLFELNRFEEAKVELKMCDELDLLKEQHNIILGKIAYLTGDKNECFKLFDQSIKHFDGSSNLINISKIGYFFHELGEKELAYKYYNENLAFKKWNSLSDYEVEQHIKKHCGNEENEKMHSVFSFPVSINILNKLIENIDKVGIKNLYDVYQIKCENAGKMIVDDSTEHREDYITILTLPFTKKIMLSYPDLKQEKFDVKYKTTLDEILSYINDKNKENIKLYEIGSDINVKEDINDLGDSNTSEEENNDIVDNIVLKTMEDFNTAEEEIKFEEITTNNTLEENNGIVDNNTIGTMEESNMTQEEIKFEEISLKEDNVMDRSTNIVNPKPIEPTRSKEVVEGTIVEENIPPFVSKSMVTIKFEECKHQIKSLIGLLNDPTEQTVLLLRLPFIKGESHTKEEIAKFLNMSLEDVTYIEKSAMNNLSTISNSFIDSTRKILEF